MKTLNFVIILVSLLVLIEFVSCQDTAPAPAPAPAAPAAPTPPAPPAPSAPPAPAPSAPVNIIPTTIGTQTVQPDTSSVPAKIQVPKGNTFAFLLNASGNQRYQCIINPKQWVNNGTDAKLINDKNDGRQHFDPAFEIVDHFVNKTQIEGGNYAWDSLLPGDTSQVVAKLVDSADSAQPDRNLPWELTSATFRKEGGRLSNTSYVLRINTIGGAAPPLDQCGVQYIDGFVLTVPYTADYLFYYGPLTSTSTDQPSQPSQPAPSQSSKTNDGYSTKPIGPGKLSWVAIVGFIVVGVISF